MEPRSLINRVDYKLRLCLDEIEIEDGGVLYKVKVVPRYQKGDITSEGMILVLEEIKEEK